MQSLIVDLHNYVKTVAEPYAPMTLDFLGSGSEAIALRPEPGIATESRDMTGTRYGDFQFAIYCMSADPATATEQLYRYMKALDLTEFELSEGVTIKCEPVTNPHLITQYDTKIVVYAANFHVEYRKE